MIFFDGAAAEYATDLGPAVASTKYPGDIDAAAWRSFMRPLRCRRPAGLAASAYHLELVVVNDHRDRVPSALRTSARYAYAVAACAITTAVAVGIQPWLDPANLIMLFLLTVVLVAWTLGRAPAVLAAVVSVAAFDYFCVPPRLDFAVADAQYLVTFAVMLTVGLITGQLTASLRSKADLAEARARRARVLFELARDLATAVGTDSVVATAVEQISHALGTRVVMMLPDADGRLVAAGASEGVDAALARSAYENGRSTGAGTQTQSYARWRYVPLRAPMRTRGVIVLEWTDASVRTSEDERHLETLVALTAMALERVHYVEVAQTALVHMESERLRHTLLAALSHDLRTPVAAIAGLAESLGLTQPALSSTQSATAQSIVEEARRMGRLIDNLLEMARLSSGPVELRREWQTVEEVVGAALRSARTVLATHDVNVMLDPMMPLVEFDAVLIERVLYNLLENAGKYTPQTSRIEVSARVTGDAVEVCVSDDGPGVPPGQEEDVFEKFVRGSHESATPGVGLGLAISRAIVQAHGGEIRLDRRKEGGARFCFTLPLGRPPSMPVDDAIAAETRVDESR